MYIQMDDNGNITFWDGQQFPGSVKVDYEVVRGRDGKPYKVGEEPAPPLVELQAAKRAEINAGFDAALAASLTMPSVNTPPSTVELTVAIGLFNAEDPTGLVDLCAIHEARRASLLAAVNAATTPEAVQAIIVSYAV